MNCTTFLTRLLSRSVLLGATVVLALMAMPSTAFADGFDMQQFHPVPDQHRSTFGSAAADVGAHGQWSGFALMNFAYAPLVVVDDQDQDRVTRLVTSQNTLHLLGSLSLYDRFEIGADIPVIAFQGSGSDIPDAVTPVDGGAGIGDLRLMPRAELFSTRPTRNADGFAVAAAVDVHLPTGRSDSLQGGDFRAGPRVIADAVFGDLRFGTNLDYQYRPGGAHDNLQVNDTIGWSLFGEFQVHETTSITAELFGRLTPASGFDATHSPTELMAGAKSQLDPVFLVGGAGVGLVNGYGTPDWRGFIGVGVPVGAEQPRALPAPTDAQCAPETVDADCPPVQPDCSDGTLVEYATDCIDGVCQYEETETPCQEGYICGRDAGVDACIPDPDIDRVRVTEDDDQIELTDRVLFGVNSDEIDPDSEPLLDDVVEVLEDNPHLTHIRIEGHTDAAGARDHNLDLSQRRAESVMDYLVDSGIDADRLSAEGLGPDEPIATNETDEGRRQNRRVEFHIVERE